MSRSCPAPSLSRAPARYACLEHPGSRTRPPNPHKVQMQAFAKGCKLTPKAARHLDDLREMLQATGRYSGEPSANSAFRAQPGWSLNTEVCHPGHGLQKARVGYANVTFVSYSISTTSLPPITEAGTPVKAEQDALLQPLEARRFAPILREREQAQLSAKLSWRCGLRRRRPY